MTTRRTDLPLPLLVVAVGAALEALALLGTAVLELVNISSVRLALGASTTVFFLLCGGGLLLCAWAVTRLAPWSRAPIVLAQLIQLGVAWNFWGGETKVVSVVLALVAAVVLVAVFHPASTSALVDDPTGSRDRD